MRPVTKNIALRNFIEANRVEIDERIDTILGKKVKRNDSERRSWIMNEETLYDWAVANGVKI